MCRLPGELRRDDGCWTAAGESLSPSCCGLVTRLMHEGRPNLVCLTSLSFLIGVRVLAFLCILSRLVPRKGLVHVASTGGVLLCPSSFFPFAWSIFVVWPHLFFTSRYASICRLLALVPKAGEVALRCTPEFLVLGCRISYGSVCAPTRGTYVL